MGNGRPPTVRPGDRFGRWLVIQYTVSRSGRGQALCDCDCGTRKLLRTDALRSGQTTSCGCRRNELATRHGEARVGHRTRLHRVWGAMLDRCYNPRDRGYGNYGGRGITVCAAWRLPNGEGYKRFAQWARSHGYAEGLMLDRVDNDGNYMPRNCRWVGRIEQNRNTRRNPLYVLGKESKTLADWAEDLRCVVSYNTLRQRVQIYNWPLKRALSVKSRGPGRVGSRH